MVKRIKIAFTLASTVFWVPIIVSFFQSKGLELQEVYYLVTFFSASMVLMEYPTGVIGDYYSHKVSVQWGFLIQALAMFASLLLLPKAGYFIILFIQAIGYALASGSNIALLHKYSKDFQKDIAHVKSLGLIALLIGTTVGGYLGTFNLNYPVFLSALAVIAGAFLIFTMKTEKDKQVPEEGNLFAKAKEGYQFIKKEKKLWGMITMGSILVMFMLSMKWFYNTIFADYSIDPSLWGPLISAGFLFTALGSFIIGKKQSINLTFLTILTVLSIFLMGMVNTPTMLITAMLGYALFHGMYEAKYTHDLNKLLKDGTRASILSLNSLLTRAIYALFTGSVGFALGFLSVQGVFLFTALIFSFVLLTSMVLEKRFTS